MEKISVGHSETGVCAKGRQQDQGNNEQISRGVFELHGQFTALTFSQSKTFKTRAGAERWLAARGYGPNGERAA